MSNPGDKKIYGLLGQKISYSLSPIMHNAAFRHFGIDAEYGVFDIVEEDLEGFTKEYILTGKVSGLNVTVPYKVRMKGLLEKHHARLYNWVNVTGALNTIKTNAKEISGYNTDVEGFKRALLGDMKFSIYPPRKKYFIFGAGGAGRAICFYLAFMHAARVYVYDMDREKLLSLEEDFKKNEHVPKDVLVTVSFAGDITKALESCDLIINATPVGTENGDERSVIPLSNLKNGLAVYDLVYARETALVRNAKAKGLVASGGLGMLINQGALAFEIWTQKPFDEVRQVMTEAVKDIL